MPRMNARYFALLSLLWLPNALFWSAIMVHILPERTEHFVKAKVTQEVTETMKSVDTPPDAREKIIKERVDATKGRYIALIGGLGALISTLIQLLIGPLSDNTTHRKGRRYPYLVWGTLLNTVPVLVFGLSGSFTQLLIAFVFIQLLLNVATGPFQALIPDVVPLEYQGRASSFLGFWQLIGQVGGLLGGGLALAYMEANTAVAGMCVFCAALFLLCLGLHVRNVQETPLSPGKAQPLRRVVRESFDLQLKPYPDFTRLLISRFIINVGIYTGIEFLRYYVQSCLHISELYPPQEQGKIVALVTMGVSVTATLGGVLGTFKAGALADKTSKRHIIYFTCAVSAASAVLYCLNHAIWGALVIGFIFGIAYGAFCAVDWAFATNLMPEGKEAKYMAIFHIAFTVPQVLVLVFGGLLADAVAAHYGGNAAYRAVFWTIPIYLAIGAALISKVRERHEIEAAAKAAAAQASA